MFSTLTLGPDGKTYKVNQEMWFNPLTPDRVILLLIQAQQNNTRLKLTYGDILTGKEWGDVESGTIGRSTGSIKIPLLIKTKRSLGGGGILTHCIVKIEYTNKKNGRAPLWDVTGRGYKAE